MLHPGAQASAEHRITPTGSPESPMNPSVSASRQSGIQSSAQSQHHPGASVSLAQLHYTDIVHVRPNNLKLVSTFRGEDQAQESPCTSVCSTALLDAAQIDGRDDFGAVFRQGGNFVRAAIPMIADHNRQGRAGEISDLIAYLRGDMAIVHILLMVHRRHDHAAVRIDGDHDLDAEFVFRPILAFTDTIRLRLMRRIDMLRPPRPCVRICCMVAKSWACSGS